jgi:phosphate transport system substrate-binding protein
MRTFRSLIVFTVICLVGVVPVVSAEEITIVGTGAGTVILKALGDAFSRENPGVTITIPESIGTGGGIKAVGRDEYLLGRVARDIQEKEKPYGLTYVAYAKEPIVFLTNKSVTVKDLATQQILDIYSGKVSNWKEVGGSDGNIRVVIRQEGDSALDTLLKSFPGFKDITVTAKAKTTFSNSETEQTVLNTANVIAYSSYSNAKVIDINILTINGKSATEADYPYISTLGFVYKAANYTGNIKKFVEFATSEAARQIIKEAGGLPL